MADKKVILVVDDEPHIRRMIKFKFQKEGYEVLAASDGLEAVYKAKHFKPDIILMDVMMPKMNGYEATRAIKQDTITKNIPIIMLTALGQEGSREKGKEVGADEYITKPFSPNGLVSLVEGMLRK